MNNFEEELFEQQVSLNEDIDEVEIDVDRENVEEMVLVEKELTIEVVNKNYEALENKPLINEVILIGNRTSRQLGLQDEMSELSNIDIKNLIGE